MDIEQQFISALLHASRPEQNRYFARQISPAIFKQREPEIRWIYEQREKHGRFPSPMSFALRFKAALPKVADTIPETVDAVIGQEHYRQIKRVVESSRELIDQGRDMAQVVSYFKKEAQSLKSYDTSGHSVNFQQSQGALRRYADLVKEIKTPTGNLFTSPWPRLNKLAKYFRPQDLIMLVGRLGLGKSWLMVDWAEHVADCGSKVLLVSKEMSTEAVEDRLEAMRFRLDWEKFRAGELSSADLLRWKRARMKRNIPNIVIDGHETMKGTGFDDIVAAIEREQPDAVFIDAAYRIAVSELGPRADERSKLVCIAQTGKRLAKAYNVPVWMSTQMNRNAEDKAGNTKGTVKDVFGSDAWMQEADAAFEVSGNRQVDNQRLLSILKGREFKGIGDIMLNFQLAPYPDFSECTSQQIASATPTTQFKGI